MKFQKWQKAIILLVAVMMVMANGTAVFATDNDIIITDVIDNGMSKRVEGTFTTTGWVTQMDFTFQIYNGDTWGEAYTYPNMTFFVTNTNGNQSDWISTLPIFMMDEDDLLTVVATFSDGTQETYEFGGPSGDPDPDCGSEPFCGGVE